MPHFQGSFPWIAYSTNRAIWPLNPEVCLYRQIRKHIFKERTRTFLNAFILCIILWHSLQGSAIFRDHYARLISLIVNTYKSILEKRKKQGKSSIIQRFILLSKIKFQIIICWIDLKQQLSSRWMIQLKTFRLHYFMQSF